MEVHATTPTGDVLAAATRPGTTGGVGLQPADATTAATVGNGVVAAATARTVAGPSGREGHVARAYHL